MALLVALAGCGAPATGPAPTTGVPPAGTSHPPGQDPPQPSARPPSALPPPSDVVPEAGSPTILATLQANVVHLSLAWDLPVELAAWDFGDGATSDEVAPQHTYRSRGAFTVTVQAWSGDLLRTAAGLVTIEQVPFEPHVIVAVSDSGVNPYHEVYYRPERTEHPCTYIEGFPCSIPALPLSVGGTSWQKSFAADKALWDAIKPGATYWIPRTAFVAVHCGEVYDQPAPGIVGTTCILDENEPHGTGTTSSVLMENPDALLAFSEGLRPFYSQWAQAGIPIDILSMSVGNTVPAPAFVSCGEEPGLPRPALYVHAAGNEPGTTTLADCWASNPYLIQVGGASASPRGQEPLAYKEPDVVSYYCRPTALTRSTDGGDSMCGTSFAAPTVAGALSKVVLGLRRHSGYTGGTVGGMVDPILGVSAIDVRNALNRTASYEPKAQYQDACGLACVPLNGAAPWTQWGWGFYDGTVAQATLKHLLGQQQPQKPAEAILYQETIHKARLAGH